MCIYTSFLKITLFSVCSDADKQAFQTWQQYDDVEDSFCEPDGRIHSSVFMCGRLGMCLLIEKSFHTKNNDYVNKYKLNTFNH